MRGIAWPKRDVGVALLPCQGAEEGAGGASKRNPGEAQQARRVLRRAPLIAPLLSAFRIPQVVALLRSVLAAGDVRPHEVGVVTPYVAQVALRRPLPMMGMASSRAPSLVARWRCCGSCWRRCPTGARWR